MINFKQKLDKLDIYAEILSVAATTEKIVFIKSPLIYGGAERYIILGYKLILEASKEMLEHYDFSNSNEPEAIVKILGTNRVYPPWLTKSLAKNINYGILKNNEDLLLQMDKEKLYYLLDEFIKDFRHYRKFVLEYVI